MDHSTAGARARRAARRRFIRACSKDVPEAEWRLSTVFAGDVLYREWTAIAEGVGRRIGDGIGTFVFRDGQIRVQAVRYTVQPIGQ